MSSEVAFRYGGAVVVALVFGLGLGFAVSPEAGVAAGVGATFGWLLLGVFRDQRRAKAAATRARSSRTGSSRSSSPRSRSSQPGSSTTGSTP